MTLEIQNISKTLGGRVVVNNVSFRVEDGEFFVLLGTSGSGKSTLLRIIAGLEKPDSGRILLDGKDITSAQPRERNLGMVFQDYGLYPNMNVFGNIAYGLEARGMGRNEVETRVNDAARKLQIDGYLKKSISDLSGGEQQRVALARALAKDSAAFLFDEPLSNLDPKLRFTARRDVQEVHRLKRKPTLYVTHDQTEAFALADRIGILSNGQMQQIGTAETLMHAPANTFVAGFLGTAPINLMVAEVAAREGETRLCVDDLALSVPPAWETALKANGKRRVIVGIRPDALTAQEGGGNPIAGRVEAVEELLGETILMLRVSERSTLTALLTDFEPFGDDVGRRLTVYADPDSLLLFDMDTQQALERT